MKQQFAKMLAVIAVPAALIYPTLASSEENLVIHPTPNKAACQSTTIKIGESSTQSELCVQQGHFSPDKYSLKFNGKNVLEGIDDQTTSGIQASHNGKPVSLQCQPQIIQPNVTPAEIQKLIPSYSAEKAKEVSGLMAGSSMPIEIGRLCQVSIESQAVMKVQVLFD